MAKVGQNPLGKAYKKQINSNDFAVGGKKQLLTGYQITKGKKTESPLKGASVKLIESDQNRSTKLTLKSNWVMKAAENKKPRQEERFHNAVNTLLNACGKPLDNPLIRKAATDFLNEKLENIAKKTTLTI